MNPFGAHPQWCKGLFLPLHSILTQLGNKSLTYDLSGIFGIKTMGDRQTDMGYVSNEIFPGTQIISHPELGRQSSSSPILMSLPLVGPSSMFLWTGLSALPLSCPVAVSCIVPAGLLPSSCPRMFDPGSSQQPGLFPLNLRSHRSSLLRTPLGLPSVLRLKSNGFIQACSGTERPGTHSPETQQNSVGTGGGWRLQPKQGVFFLDIEGIWSWIHLCWGELFCLL